MNSVGILLVYASNLNGVVGWTIKFHDIQIQTKFVFKVHIGIEVKKIKCIIKSNRFFIVDNLHVGFF